MARAPDPRIEQAKAMYLEGKKLVEIASQLNLPEGTVRRWKSTHKWDSERSERKKEKKKKLAGANRYNDAERVSSGNTDKYSVLRISCERSVLSLYLQQPGKKRLRF